MNKRILIFTELPFRRQGNQSLLRFAEMFLQRGVQLTLCTSGKDDLGTNSVEHSLIKIHEFPIALGFIKKLFFSKKEKKDITKNTHLTAVDNHFSSLHSEDILPPFGAHTFKFAVRKWIAFTATFIENTFLIVYAMLFYRSELKETNVIIGYECSYTFAAKFLARLYRKKYINKFQGTVLAGSNRDLWKARLFYPYFWYGINKSDLCVMVNDGTDGEFYAHRRGCENVYFNPHGVSTKDYDNPAKIPKELILHKDKLVLFNNASRSRWKRVDRIIRALSLLPEELRAHVHLLTTYHADDKPQLEQYTKDLWLDDTVTFLTNVDHIESNAFIQHCDVVVMTNEMSNLGNPVLEAIYYGTPVLSLNDGSLNDFVIHNVDGYLVDITGEMDQNMADVLSRMLEEKEYLSELRLNMEKNQSVNSLQKQQDLEFTKFEHLFHD